jgi:regulator of sirC expression with transglutaminase-like and TPR domain
MPYSLNLSARGAQVAGDLERAMNSAGEELAPAALAIARVEYPSLEAAPYLVLIDRMGAEAASRVRGISAPADAVRALNEYLYDEQGFTGNREHYDDPRNSFLNDVLDRRTGIPIALAVVYLEVARRAGLAVSGVNFPGHFLLRGIGAHAVDLAGDSDLSRRSRSVSHAAEADDALIIDPFHGGALLSETDCRQLLRQHIGDEAAFDHSLLAPATRRDIVVRMLVNLKRLYVRMRSFPQARFIADLLLTVDPSAISELRDRGLLAYHLQDFAAALRDLEEYLRLVPKRAGGGEIDEDPSSEEDSEEDETAQVWEHVKALRKRVAGFN